MGFLDMLLGGYHGRKYLGGHHDDDVHRRRRQGYDPGWGHGNVCDHGRDGRLPSRNAGLPTEAGALLTCPSCRTANSAAARFCQQCGTALSPLNCAQCGAQVPGGSKFCSQCGKPCP